MALFKIDEVLQIAMQAEEAGRLLYGSLARESSDPQVGALCERLARQEQAHFETFQRMRQSQPSTLGARGFSLDEMDYVRRMVEGRVVPSEVDARNLVRQNSLAAVLDMAIQAEVDSVEFYRQILVHVGSGNTAEIREIIEEEKQHEQALRRVRQDLRA